MIPIFNLLVILFKTTGNFGVAIICLTLIVRGLMFPIAQKQFQSMAAMRKVQPKMKAIQERHKDDKPRQQQEILKLYQSEKINPAAGCLPILLQIPVFYALYKVLMVSVEMRHQPFALWIKDLSAPDPLTPVNLFGLLAFTPPHFLALGVLPILLGITMWMQFKLNPQQMDPTQQQIFAIMPWVMMFVMAPFAAGLQLYWVVPNILTIAQQWWLYKRYGLDNVRHPRRSTRDQWTADEDLAERARKLFAGPIHFLKSAPGLQFLPDPTRAGDRLRRPLQRRQELAVERARQPQGAGAHLEHARAARRSSISSRSASRSRSGWSTCPATASPRRPRTWSSAGAS